MVRRHGDRWEEDEEGGGEGDGILINILEFTNIPTNSHKICVLSLDILNRNAKIFLNILFNKKS